MRYYSTLLLVLVLYVNAEARQTTRRQKTALPYKMADTAAIGDPYYFPQAKDTPLQARIVGFAKTLIGTPYKYACSAPSMGFDCSGFITYVFNHFNITVPRSSVDFTHEGIGVTIDSAKPGDLILFTGTDSRTHIVGHIGIIVSNDSMGTTFIHSSSGSDYSVVVTPLNDYYKGRFVGVRRILK